MFNEASIKRVNEALGDKQSKEIFANRILYSLTKDRSYVEAVIKAGGKGKELWNRLSLENRPIVVCCINDRVKKMFESLPNLNWTAFSDNDPEIREFHNLSKVDRKFIHMRYPDAIVLVSAKTSGEMIKKELLEEGVPENSIVLLGKYWNGIKELQYFDLQQLNIGNDEVFVDCGAFDMFNTDQIIDKCQKVYAFEPDKDNYLFCINKYKDYVDKRKVVIYPYATLDKRTKLNFSAGQKGSSMLSESEGNTVVECVTLDETVNDRVTFIKMDVEGAEYASLLGGEKLIKKFHPKLAVCVYHLEEDIVKIPELILSLDSSYKLYLRHYKFDEHETVLYAV